MISITFLPHLKQHVKLARLICCLPFEWHPRTDNLVPVKGKFNRFLVKVQMTLQLVHTIGQFVSTAISTRSTNTKMQTMVFTTIYATGHFLRWNWHLDTVAMELLNSFINFERNFFRRKNNLMNF